MSRNVRLVGTLGVALLIAANVVGGPTVSATHTSVVLGEGLSPRTDGTTAVWAVVTGEPGDLDIYGANIVDGEAFAIATGPNDQKSPSIDNGVVIWEETAADCAPDCQSDIRGKNLITGETFDVAANDDRNEVDASISGSWVIWRSYASSDDPISAKLVARDISSTAAPVTVVETSASVELGSGPVIDGDRVVWVEVTYADTGGYPLIQPNWKLLSRRIADDAVTVIAEGLNGRVYEDTYDIAGDTVVYRIGNEVHAVDPESGETRLLSTTATDLGPTTDGRYVVWADNRFWQLPEVSRRDIWAYDLLTDSSFLVTDVPTIEDDPHLNNFNPDLHGNVLVWVQSRFEVHAISIHDVLPTARRLESSPPGSASVWFSETGHHLTSGFKTFWEQRGDLPVFGYPLTEEFVESNADTGQFHTTQYFERQRFEWHPENIGTPYEVLLGRLGAELLVAQGRDWRTFGKADPRSMNYFPETGHAVAPMFFDYWSGHGLEFGDEGTTFRESLALSGYPISPPMLETNADGDTVLTQYFERAVFEFHPNNVAEHQVLLRRVGAEVLDARGW